MKEAKPRGEGRSRDGGLPRVRDCLSTSLTKFDTTEVQAVKGGWRERVELATKFGIIYENRRAEVHGDPEVRGDPTYVRATCEASLKRLDTHCIDLYYQPCIDTCVPVEITVCIYIPLFFPLFFLM
ncbi:auxin-induced protein PCNT115-like [Rhododendron vialii]|uniref:auxin-induced protein PCNT115-like n=1 Tax=Rhododendron vialii TaxID=182163 RepID=UPI00265F23CE|nr:auxin-induced protein PCNT115-like [Rhododendron vialii]